MPYDSFASTPAHERDARTRYATPTTVMKDCREIRCDRGRRLDGGRRTIHGVVADRVEAQARVHIGGIIARTTIMTAKSFR